MRRFNVLDNERDWSDYKKRRIVRWFLTHCKNYERFVKKCIRKKLLHVSILYSNSFLMVFSKIFKRFGSVKVLFFIRKAIFFLNIYCISNLTFGQWIHISLLKIYKMYFIYAVCLSIISHNVKNTIRGHNSVMAVCLQSAF